MINLDGYEKTIAAFNKHWIEDGDHRFRCFGVYRRDTEYFYLDDSWTMSEKLVPIVDPLQISEIKKIDSEADQVQLQSLSGRSR
jgi:hypothetical protein